MGRKNSFPETRDEILKAIGAYKERRSFGPSVRELSEMCNIPPSTMQHHLNILELYGYIERKQGKARTIRVLTAEERETL